MNKREIIKKYPKIVKLGLFIVSSLPWNNVRKMRGKNNKIIGKNTLRIKCRFKIKGDNNTIQFADWSRCHNTRFTVFGNNNHIIIGKYASINEGDFWIEDNKGAIEIGAGTSITGKTHLASIEGCRISVGRNCLFSSEVVIRTGDSHSLLSMTGERINPSADVTLKDRVWVGNKVTILKGVKIESDSVIAAGAIVTKSISQPNVVIGGTPGKVMKSDIKWTGERI